jgi:O-antigen/teichoic acid export membrane protein
VSAPVIESDESAAGLAAAPRGDDGRSPRGTRRIGAKTIRRGLVFSLAGTLVSAAVAVVGIPRIVGGMGSARFGLLASAWTFINAIGILDLGVGRALTRFLAVHEDRDANHEAAVVWTALGAMLLVGSCGAAAAWGLSEPIAATLARADPSLRAEIGPILRVLALSAPLLVVSSGLRGILEAFGRCDLTNSVAVPIALLNVLIPLALLRYGASLWGIVCALVLLRLVGTLVLVEFAIHVMPAMRKVRLSGSGMRSVLAFAGWVTVSNVVGPLFAQAERYFLGSFVTLSAVAFYGTPADLLSRVTIIPAAILQVLFPVLAQRVQIDRARAAQAASRAMLFIAAAVLPALTALVAIAPEALQLWLGPEFAVHGARAGRILAAGVFVNCMAWLPSSLVQGAGRASWTGKLHAVEIPLYLALSAWLTHAAAIDGAALANLFRAAVDAAVVVWMASRVLGPASRLARQYALLAGVGVIVMLGAAAPVTLGARLGWSVAALSAAGVAMWRYVLDAEARETLSSQVATAWARIREVAT